MNVKYALTPSALRSTSQKTPVDLFSSASLRETKRFHETMPGYEPTPLTPLPNLAKHIGVLNLWVKDESKRFGLNAFKVLGTSYAMAKHLALKLGIDLQNTSFDELTTLARKQPDVTTFTTATDGNHGRAVAWVARKLGQKAVVYLPKGSSQSRLQAILDTGAQGYVTDLNYDDAVRMAASNALAHGWQVVQDTAWEGYEEIPLWIMQGYTTIAAECAEQLAEPPTHIILQAGVGSFAGAMQGYFAAQHSQGRPRTLIVEPENAACLFKSILKGDGLPHAVTGDLKTIMAGLSCGEPNPLGWAILRDYADAFFSVGDDLAEAGMRILAHPLGDDPRVISGESGAVGIGLTALLFNDSYKALREQLALTSDSRILCISTEGDTDPKSYELLTRRRQ